MSNSKTIDGVPRERLEDAARAAKIAGYTGLAGELRALLDAPTAKNWEYFHNAMESERDYWKALAQKAARPQGEPYAYEYEFATVLYASGPGKFKKIITHEAPDRHEIDAGCIINVKPLYGAEPQKYDDTLMPFLALMRKELHANSHKGDREGWLGMTLLTAMNELTHHHDKLGGAVEAVDAPQIAEYAADVANCAMMLADVCGLLTKNQE